ncbi:hypothetical protein ABVL59_004816 [Salmonella enterica]|nr:hypothetical protein [Salmonella enterica]ECA7250776.1 hypothetical protein [Salmonella enterica subsp. enterica serovar Oranienburg]EDU5440319.1 hypothetical protein [Salmonella enterica subsp. enterica serovar Hadar]EHB3663572.1 hypothetical protein [Salmonella enterica subsp. enterica serovar Bredeney]EHL0893950.1 hypothetical protein [Salmonella enterica subsp. enterica serovar Durban]
MSNAVKERDVPLKLVEGTHVPHTEHNVSFSGGDGGDGMGSDLEKRVERLEGDTLIIKDKLTALSVRSESFATKSDLAELKSELKSDMSSLETRIMVNMMQAVSNSQNAIMDKMDRRFDRVDDNTKWRLSGVILPVGSVIVTAVVAFLIAKYVSH